MTAAKAVEMSVTSTNSLSQDYTNLDDQLPQTCHNIHETKYQKRHNTDLLIKVNIKNIANFSKA